MAYLCAMNDLEQKIAALAKEIKEFESLEKDAAENFRILYLGSNGLVKSMMGIMKDVPAEKKKEVGLQLNALKQLAEEKYGQLKSGTGTGNTEKKDDADLSLPGISFPIGSRHPICIVRNHIISIFNRIGFVVTEGAEIEDDWHNFTALNMHEHHPARDMQDTFYLRKNPDWLLRTHTSSVQVREMEKGYLPLRIICPGRVYRNETISARAHCFFHQVEGLYVAEEVSFADLKQTLYYFVKEMFGKDVKIRFRPSYFPFTEPSAEMDISCLICGGEGCSVCKYTGWVEILGCGMVHPNVLENCGISSEKYTGFAFGMGIERITMLKYGINDLRIFSENDLRFLHQFAAIV